MRLRELSMLIQAGVPAAEAATQLRTRAASQATQAKRAAELERQARATLRGGEESSSEEDEAEKEQTHT